MLNNVKNYFKHEFLKDLMILIGCFCLGKFLTLFFMISFIPTGSMTGTINVGNCVFVEKVSEAKTVEHGDIVVFQIEGDSKYYIKRVIALPGDTIEIKDTIVYLNGEILEEPYLYSNSMPSSVEEITLEEGMYFMMGDNRDNSYDCRYWGPLPLNKQTYVGKALFKLLPPGKLK